MSLDLFRYGYFVTAQCDLLRKDLIIYMLHEASQPVSQPRRLLVMHGAHIIARALERISSLGKGKF